MVLNDVHSPECDWALSTVPKQLHIMDERLRLFAENPIPRDDIPTLENQIGFGQKGDF